MKVNATIISRASRCVLRRFGPPYSRPLAPSGLIVVVASIAVSIIPQAPPMPWHGNTSSVSSTLVLFRRFTAV